MEPVRTVNHDQSGRFTKGNKANPKGNNQFTSIVPLLEALEQTGIERGQDFWKMVAEKCYGSRNESLLIAILKKILPDRISGEGFVTDIKTVFIIPESRKNRLGEDVKAISI